MQLLLLLLLSHFSHVRFYIRFCATPWNPRLRRPWDSPGKKEHWSGSPFPSPMHESEKGKWSHSVVSDSSRPHGRQPTRLLRPSDFPGKIEGLKCAFVGIVFFKQKPGESLVDNAAQSCSVDPGLFFSFSLSPLIPGFQRTEEHSIWEALLPPVSLAPPATTDHTVMLHECCVPRKTAEPVGVPSPASWSLTDFCVNNLPLWLLNIIAQTNQIWNWFKG